MKRSRFSQAQTIGIPKAHRPACLRRISAASSGSATPPSNLATQVWRHET